MTDFYRLLFDRSSDAHFILDETGIFDCNQAAVELLGCASKEDVLHIHPATLSPEYQPDGSLSSSASRQIDELTHEKGWHRFEWYHRKINGEVFPVQVTLNSIVLDGRKMLLGVWHDLTDTKKKESELHQLNSDLIRANLRMRDDLEAAAEVQRGLLPRADIALPHLKAAWAYLPSETLGGDQLNIFHLNDNALGFYCLDVTGHGVAAALLAVSVSHFLSPLTENSLVKTADGQVVPPKDVLAQLNRQFRWKGGKPQFLTILYGVFSPDERRLRYACAGCPGPIYFGKGSEPRFLDTPGFAVGMFEQATYDEQELLLSAGDRLFIYSDGVSEAANAAGDQFEKERLAATLAAHRAEAVGEQVQAVLESVLQWCAPATPRDDISLLAFDIA